MPFIQYLFTVQYCYCIYVILACYKVLITRGPRGYPPTRYEGVKIHIFHKKVRALYILLYYIYVLSNTVI
jgi:hypothetical protein